MRRWTALVSPQALASRDLALQQQAMEVRAALTSSDAARDAMLGPQRGATTEGIDPSLSFLDAFCESAAAEGRGGRYVPAAERNALSRETGAALRSVLHPATAGAATAAVTAPAQPGGLKFEPYAAPSAAPPAPPAPGLGDWSVVQGGTGDLLSAGGSQFGTATSASSAAAAREPAPAPAPAPAASEPVLLASQRTGQVAGTRRWGPSQFAPPESRPAAATEAPAVRQGSTVPGAPAHPSQPAAPAPGAGGSAAPPRRSEGEGDEQQRARAALAASLFGSKPPGAAAGTSAPPRPTADRPPVNAPPAPAGVTHSRRSALYIHYSVCATSLVERRRAVPYPSATPSTLHTQP